MNTIIIFIGLWLAYWLLKRIYNSLRFQNLQNEYFAKWQVLSIEEKETILYADQGLRLRYAEESLTSNARSKQSAGGLETYAIDYHLDNINEVLTSCPRFDTFDSEQLDQEFHKILNSHWKAMRSIGDYDFVGTRAELDTLFANAAELSHNIKSRLKKLSTPS